MVDRSNRRMTQRGNVPPMARGCMSCMPESRADNNRCDNNRCDNNRYDNNRYDNKRSDNNRGDNNCGCGMASDCKAMMRRLQTVEFSMYDTMLYLDMYPECKEALAYYQKLCEERDALRASLAKRCKRPTTAPENDCDSGWAWIASPWPWDPSAN